MYKKLWKSRNHMIVDLTLATILTIGFIVITIIEDRKDKF